MPETDDGAPRPARGRGQPRKLPEGTVRTNVRLPPDLLAELRAAAQRAGHSVNDEVIRRCRTGTVGGAGSA